MKETLEAIAYLGAIPMAIGFALYFFTKNL